MAAVVMAALTPDDADIDEARTWTYTVPVSPKSMREAMCVATTSLGRAGEVMDPFVKSMETLIRECDRHRPRGADGKHGDLHTPTCGCEDA